MPSNLLLKGSKEGNAEAPPSKNVLVFIVEFNMDDMSAVLREPVALPVSSADRSGTTGFTGLLSGITGPDSGSESSGLYGSSEI